MTSQAATVLEPAADPLPTPDGRPRPRRDLDAPAPTGCVTIAVDEEDACVVRLRGALGRGAIARVDAVLAAVEAVSRPVVVDLARARTRDRRLLRVLADVAMRRRAVGRRMTLRGAHPDVVGDLDGASLPETFLVYEAVCRECP